MRLKLSLPLFIGVGLTAGVVSLSGNVACGCIELPSSASDMQTEEDSTAPESEVFLEPARSRWLRDAEEVPAEEVPDGMVPIVYGYPTPEAMEAAKRGEIILGGCLVSPGQPQFGFPKQALKSEW